MASNPVTLQMEELQKFIKDSVESVVQSIIPAEFHALRQAINECIDKVETKMDSRILVLEERLESLENENLRMSQIIQELEGKIDSENNGNVGELQVRQTAMEKNIRDALLQSNNNEQYSRRDSIRIYGIPLPVSENISDHGTNDDCEGLVIKLANEKLNMDLSRMDIEAAHRVGRVKDNLQPVIVKFHRRATRDKMIMKRKQLKGLPVRIHEDLTRLNASLLNRLGNSPLIHKSWSWMGKIWAIAKGSGAKKVKVQPFEELESIISRSSN